jgi:predicted small secreted protein
MNGLSNNQQNQKKMKKMKNIAICISIAIVATMLSSCATILSGVEKNNTVSFESSPPGAVVHDRNGRELCITPCTAVVKPNPWRNFTKITMSHGEESYDILLAHSPDPKFYLNTLFLLLSPIAMTVDAITGAHTRYLIPNVNGVFQTQTTSSQVEQRSLIRSVPPATGGSENSLLRSVDRQR